MMLASLPMLRISTLVSVIMAAPLAILTIRAQMLSRVFVVRIASHEVHLGNIGNDVGGDAAFGDDVVDAGVGGDVLAEELDAVAQEHDGVECGAAAVGGHGGVGCDSVKGEAS